MNTVSVISCCRNEISMVERFLHSIDAQQRVDFEFELIIADGASEDGTTTVLQRFASERPWVRVIGNERRIASTGLNAAIRLARGSVIIRMDAHTEYASDYVAECVRVLRETDAAMAGGPMRMARGSTWQNALGLAYGSKMFSGGSRVYDISYSGPVDSVLYGCWPARIIKDAGGFDENMVRDADDDLSFRISQAGALIWQASSIVCWYHPRGSPLALARQFFGYGFWKVYGMRKHRTVVRLRHVLPAIALAFFLLLSAGALVSPGSRLALGVAIPFYSAIVILAAAVRVRSWRDLSLLPAVAAAFPIVHAAYACGTLWGFLRGERPGRLTPAPKGKLPETV